MNTSTNASTVMADVLLALVIIATLPAEVILIGGPILWFAIRDK